MNNIKHSDEDFHNTEDLEKYARQVAKIHKLKYNDEQIDSAKSLQKSFFIGIKNNTENRRCRI